MTPVKVRTARLKAGLSVPEFAKKLGVAARTVYSWESGERQISTTAWKLLELIK